MSARWRLPLLLLGLTVLSTLHTGGLAEVAMHAAPGEEVEAPLLTLLWHGLPFSVALLGILICHEMGHFLVARRHGVDVSPPYFIPLPFGFLGTLGAAIVINERIKDRRALFDIGIAGPLAGMVVAVPVTLLGLSLSRVQSFDAYESYSEEGVSLLYGAMKWLVIGEMPPGHDIYTHPVAMAGWAGLFLTALNLIPVAQTDGGHVAYAVWGHKRQRVVARAVVAGLVLLGGTLLLLGEWGGGTWAILALLIVFGMGVDHPPTTPEPDAEGAPSLGPARTAIAALGLAIFVLCFTPLPVRVVEQPTLPPTADALTPSPPAAEDGAP